MPVDKLFKPQPTQGATLVKLELEEIAEEFKQDYDTRTQRADRQLGKRTQDCGVHEGVKVDAHVWFFQ